MGEDKEHWTTKIVWLLAGALLGGGLSFGATMYFVVKKHDLAYEPVVSTMALQLADDEYWVTRFRVVNRGHASLTDVQVYANFGGALVESTVDTSRTETTGNATMGYTFDLPRKDELSWQVTTLGPLVEESLRVTSGEVVGRLLSVDTGSVWTTAALLASLVVLLSIAFGVATTVLVRSRRRLEAAHLVVGDYAIELSKARRRKEGDQPE